MEKKNWSKENTSVRTGSEGLRVTQQCANKSPATRFSSLTVSTDYWSVISLGFISGTVYLGITSTPYTLFEGICLQDQNVRKMKMSARTSSHSMRLPIDAGIQHA